MNTDEVKHLANLARIELTDKELTDFTKEMSDILSYVSKVQALVSDQGEESEPALGARFNVFRKDEVTNEADKYTEVLLAEMPQKQGRYLEVKKILDNK